LESANADHNILKLWALVCSTLVASEPSRSATDTDSECKFQPYCVYCVWCSRIIMIII